MPLDIQACSNLPPADLARFLNANNLAFNNLDWFPPNERFNEAGCFAVIEQQQIKALLAATPESSLVAWLRFFHAERDAKHGQYFKTLFSQAKIILQNMGIQSVFSLAPHNWLESLLKAEGFLPADTIVTLQCNFTGSKLRRANPELIIREMTQRDLTAVEAIDLAAFDPVWQLKHATLEKTYHLSAWNSIAILEKEIVGYQMSTNTFDSAHLARLAVTPRWQGKGVGHRLVEDMLETLSAIGVTTFSVNTQASNGQSLSLYHSLGFEREDRDILVMSLNL
jgi:ribosomal-protein-alanine N-acetyltransferase